MVWSVIGWLATVGVLALLRQMSALYPLQHISGGGGGCQESLARGIEALILTGEADVVSGWTANSGCKVIDQLHKL